MISDARSALSQTGNILNRARSRIRNFDPPSVDDVTDEYDDEYDDNSTNTSRIYSSNDSSNDSSVGGGGGGGGIVPNSAIASFQGGGLTRDEGYAYLHPNEAVMGVEAGAEAIADAMEGTGAPQLVVEEGAIQVDGADDPEQVASEVLHQLDRKRRRLYPDG
jgi:hypothetical protein